MAFVYTTAIEVCLEKKLEAAICAINSNVKCQPNCNSAVFLMGIEAAVLYGYNELEALGDVGLSDVVAIKFEDSNSYIGVICSDNDCCESPYSTGYPSGNILGSCDEEEPESGGMLVRDYTIGTTLTVIVGETKKYYLPAFIDYATVWAFFNTDKLEIVSWDSATGILETVNPLVDGLVLSVLGQKNSSI